MVSALTRLFSVLLLYRSNFVISINILYHYPGYSNPVSSIIATELSAYSWSTPYLNFVIIIFKNPELIGFCTT